MTDNRIGPVRSRRPAPDWREPVPATTTPAGGLSQSSAIGWHASLRDAAGRRYVGRYLLLGAVSSSFASASALVYLVATPNGANRPLLYTCIPLGTVLGALCALVVRRFVGTRRETAWFLGWSAASLALIFAAALLDGGAESPMSWLLILPVAYASISYPVRATVFVAIGAFVSALALMVAGNDWTGADGFRLLFVVTFDIMALSAAINRSAYALAEERLTVVATHDGLTGCLNNAAFHSRVRVEEARAHRSGRPFSIVMCDADAFKAINDTYGHEVGDETLRAVARALLEAARAGDDIGRLGGDEFCILLAQTTSAQAKVVAHRVHAALGLMTFPAPATLSLGLATWAGDVDTGAATIRRADEAMYRAKALGGDRVVVYEAISGEYLGLVSG